MSLRQLRTKSLKALGWEFTGKAIAQSIVLLVAIFLARFLSPKDFGLVAIVMASVGIGQILCDWGLGAALIQRKNLESIHCSSVFFINTISGALLMLGMYWFSDGIAVLFGSPELSGYCKFLSILFLANALNLVQLARLRRVLNFSLIARIEVAAALAGGVTGIALAFYGAGAWALVWQMITMGVMALALTWFYSSWRPKCLVSIAALKDLWSFGLRMYVSNLLDVVCMRIDIIIIGKTHQPTLLGFFERAKVTNQVLVQNSSMTLMSVLFPVFSSIQDDLASTKSITQVGIEVLSLCTFLFLGVLYLSAEDIFEMLYGPDWAFAGRYFELLVASSFGYPISALLLNVLAGRGRSSVFLRLELIKKFVWALSLMTLVFIDLEAYLMSLILQSALAVWLSIHAVSRELNVPTYQYLRPVVVQGLISLVAAFLVHYLIARVDPAVELFAVILKSLAYLSVFLLINIVLRTKSFVSCVSQIRVEIDQMN
ncbi:lipopolysaccharide biosynthesis protein [Marinihelvus fidelis]|uniref:Lipopolysaccharide biosynthesis protein n=1 Tax=Marinihelvus fidelis TaxID=2613842 RepID=A0A5N0T5K6_9GAMM|nr:lipopolysaccharide biosynthesis protein [Marinihelvus fidelis]KAA9129744.1 lipopolysaccharide biosynthesis protein [Marinihelvus fidelis]